MTTVSLLERQKELAPSIYAEEAYGRALTAGSNRTWSVIADSRNLWQMPVVLSPILQGGHEASSPYGYSGIFADRSLSVVQVAEYWEQTLQLLRGSGVVSLFLRFPSFAYPGLGIDAFKGLKQLELELVSKTIEVATPTPDKVWSGLSGRARTATRKALKLGMTAEVSRASELTLGANSVFRDLYETTMNRIGASDHHIYGDAYYSTLLARMSEKIYVVNVTTHEGKPAASAIMLLDSSVVHYHLSGSDPEEARNGANNLLLWTILEWTSRREFQSVHLGGGLTDGDSLFDFKNSFGGSSREFWIGRAVIDEERYSTLARIHAESLGTTLTHLKASGFFPIFRAKV
ncbi:GNAT family N-acetyltransferase [Pseudarthrobacter sp. RMG13]|uniref:GNAT family N-acetyltransferase n=1 Tax=Pseudarthrobacter humi TaxID=2952523 RepID=A0ABT1LUA1_9MICC|nr:GNAT family N-acetyltransferase [Pseudarthrobacter humi]MCP9001243.1 GNAT family N-acetyltransferase [Pseudarthrobacter humi]